MHDAIDRLFAHGGPDDTPLPVACRKDGPWQSPGTVAVQVDELRRVYTARERPHLTIGRGNPLYEVIAHLLKMQREMGLAFEGWNGHDLSVTVRFRG